jgi:Na+-transporting methylmalonyl-CoA/oxaloacetate decarboxylase gamma subunit
MNNLPLSLEITALGMGLVFGAIMLLWLMMVVLTALTADKDTSTSLSEPASDSPGVDSDDPSIALTPSLLRQAQDTASPRGRGKLEQVALLAVAMALAEQGGTSTRPLEQPPTALVSAWQLGMRTRQMSEKGHPKRR